jgi:hypothetical protein
MENDKKRVSFKQYEAPNQSPFDKLFVISELITHTSGDFERSIGCVN